MKRRRLDGAVCPVARALDVIGDWWSLLIIRDAFSGITRFSGFQKSLGIARGMLTARLQGMVEVGVLEMRPASDGTAYHDYVLTRKGEALFPVIVALRQWGEGQLYRAGEKHSRLVDRGSGKPVAALEVRSRSGGKLKWSETEVRRSGS